MKRGTAASDAIEIEPGELFRALMQNGWLIVLLTGIAAMAALTVSMFCIQPVYRSSTKVYIGSEPLSGAAVTFSDLQTAGQLTNDCEELVKSRFVLETVLVDLDLDMTAEELSKAVTVSSPSGTHVLEITVEQTDPYLARDLANHIRKIAGRRIVEIMGVDAVRLVDEANLPLEAAEPQIRRNTVLGAAIGFFVGLIAAVARVLLNDLICTPDDVERYLGVSVLGVIPAEEKPKGGKRRGAV